MKKLYIMKSKTILVLMVLLIVGFAAKAQNRSINFEHGTWKEIKEKAGAENKLIFVDAYTSWCGPCNYRVLLDEFGEKCVPSA